MSRFPSFPPFFGPTLSTLLLDQKKKMQWNESFNDGSLGSHNDEERREMRYVMRIAGLSESSNL